MKKLFFFCRCVEWPEPLLPALRYLIEHGREITRETFLRHVDPDTMQCVEEKLGYIRRGRGLSMRRDWHVSYHKCRNVYYFRWSAIEYVFATREMIDALNRDGDHGG